MDVIGAYKQNSCDWIL